MRENSKLEKGKDDVEFGNARTKDLSSERTFAHKELYNIYELLILLV